MLKNLLTRLWAPSAKETLAQILTDPDNREQMIGMKRLPPISPEKIKEDMNSIIAYSESKDYAVWAKEAWSEVLECVDKLSDGKTDKGQIDFYRGALAQTLKMLRLSYRYRNMREDEAARTRRAVYPGS